MNRCLQLITDDSGKLSLSRVLMTICVIAYLTYAGAIVYFKHELPDIPGGLVALVTLLYGANKFSPTIPFQGGPQK